MRNKVIPFVKILWKNHPEREATWETEESMRASDSLAQSDEEYLDDTSALPAVLANIIGTTHTLELKSHTYYEHGTFESFTSWNLIPPETVVESAAKSLKISMRFVASSKLEEEKATYVPNLSSKALPIDYKSNENPVRDKAQ
ncbi:hypothetical protein Tco_1563414 [Tanacetum coccineum]